MLGDYFGIEMNTVVKVWLKLWLFEVARVIAAILRKQPWKILCHLAYFYSNGGLELVKLPDLFFSSNKLDQAVSYLGVL